MSYLKIAPRLYVRTFANGSQSWVYRYTIAGLTSEKGLGSYTGTGRAKLSEAAALKRATILDGQVAQGIDPWGSRARKQMTFAAIIHEIIDMGKNKKKSWAVDANGVCGTEQDYLRLIQKDAPRLARLQFNHPRIEDEVELALKPIWGTKKGEDVRLRMFKAFERAKVVRKVFQGDNPASRERIVAMLGEGRDSRSKEDGGDVKNHEALPWQEVPEMMTALAVQTGMASMALRFLVLTTARAGNVRFCSKKAIDRQTRTWTLDGNGHTGERMKAGMKHTYYLNDEAMQICNALWDRPGDYLFTNKDGEVLGPTALRDKLGPKRKGGLELQDRATPHGFRATFANWVSRNHAEKEAVADAMLAHAEGKVKSAYFREGAVETMQFLANAWGRHCAGANVVSFKREAA